MEVHNFSFHNLLGYDQFGQISGVMVVDGKTEVMNFEAIRMRRWNTSIDYSVFLGLTDSAICSVQELKKLLQNITSNEFI